MSDKDGKDAFAYLGHRTDIGIMPTDALNRDPDRQLVMAVGISRINNTLVDVGFLQDRNISEEVIDKFLRSVELVLDKAFSAGRRDVRRHLMEALGFEVMTKDIFEDDPKAEPSVIILQRD